MKLTFLLAAMLALSVPAFCQQKEPVPAPADATAPKAMVKLKMTDLSGKPVDPASLTGKVVVYDFWATWCVPCIGEIPILNNLQKKYADQGLKIVGVTMASGELDEIKPAVEKLKMQYNVVVGDDDQNYDLNIVGYPTTFLVKDDKVYNILLGGGPRKARQLEDGIRKLLGIGETASSAKGN